MVFAALLLLAPRGAGALRGCGAFRGAALRSLATSASEAPKFDAEMTAAYKQIAESHRHPAGPWTAMAEAVAARVGAGARVLDLASGPGEPAATIARALPDASVVATDVSEDMVAGAAEATRDLANVEVRLADAQALDAFGDGSFDAVTCCYGYMFPTDKPAALAETLRVLKPGGVLVATTWDSLDIAALSRDIMTRVLGEAPPPPALNPMSLSEPGLFDGLVKAAGFSDVRQTTSTYPFDLGTDRDFQFRVGTIILKQALDDMDDAGAWDRAKDGFWASIDKYAETGPDGTLSLPANTFRLTIATKP